MSEQLRIDKYLWAVRLFKTRSLATEKCKKGHVMIDDKPVKPSRFVKIGEKIEIKFPPIIRSFTVTGLLAKRASATIAKENINETTPEDEFLKISLAKNNYTHREAGAGRPTKKERREIDKFNTEI